MKNERTDNAKSRTSATCTRTFSDLSRFNRHGGVFRQLYTHADGAAVDIMMLYQQKDVVRCLAGMPSKQGQAFEQNSHRGWIV